MGLDKFIEKKYLELIDKYETEKSKKARFYNTLLQSYNIIQSRYESKKILENQMLDAVNHLIDSLNNNEQKEKFVRDNTPIDYEFVEAMLSEIVLLDTCSLSEYTLLQCNFIISCLENESEFENLIEIDFVNKCNKISDSNFRKKYDAIDNMYIFTDSNDLFNEFDDLKKSKEIFKYIFFLRNCLVHNGGIFQEYVLVQQEKVKKELKELNIPLFNLNDRVILKIDSINWMVNKLRELSELLILCIFNKIYTRLSEVAICKIDDYIKINTIN